MSRGALRIEPRTGVLLTLTGTASVAATMAITMAVWVVTPGAYAGAPCADDGATCLPDGLPNAGGNTGAGDEHHRATIIPARGERIATPAEDTPCAGDPIHAAPPAVPWCRPPAQPRLSAIPAPPRSPRAGQVLRLAPKTSPPLPRT